VPSRTERLIESDVGWILLRALLYAGCLALLALFAPSTEHAFVYQAF
jgi:hypothetical protein